MANAQKYNREACGHLFAHYERGKDKDGNYIKFGNQDIDPTRTHLNYNLAPDRGMPQNEYMKKRCSEVYCLKRADVNVMCSWVVTAPKDLPNGTEDKFFRATYNFLCERYGGEDNVISAYVHRDENRDHMHFSFVPVVYEEKKDRYKVCAKEAISQYDLQSFHKDLETRLEHDMGFRVNVLNEATRDGNKEVADMKKETALKEIKALEQKHQELLQVDSKIKWIDDVEVVEKSRWGKKTVTIDADVWERIKTAYKQVFVNAITQENTLKELSYYKDKCNTYDKNFRQLSDSHWHLKRENKHLEKAMDFIRSKGLMAEYLRDNTLKKERTATHER